MMALMCVYSVSDTHTASATDYASRDQNSKILPVSLICFNSFKQLFEATATTILINMTAAFGFIHVAIRGALQVFMFVHNLPIAIDLSAESPMHHAP